MAGFIIHLATQLQAVLLTHCVVMVKEVCPLHFILTPLLTTIRADIEVAGLVAQPEGKHRRMMGWGRECVNIHFFREHAWNVASRSMSLSALVPVIVALVCDVCVRAHRTRVACGAGWAEVLKASKWLVGCTPKPSRMHQGGCVQCGSTT